MARKNLLKNKKVVRALTIGLATVLAGPTVVPGATLAVQAAEDDTTVGVGDMEVASENMEAIENANALTEKAEELEQGVATEAADNMKNAGSFSEAGALALIAGAEDNDLPVPTRKGRSVEFKDVDDSAAEYEENASKHLEDAKDTLEDAEKKLTGDENAENEDEKEGILDTVQDKLEESEEASKDANTAAANAAAELLKADDALLAGMAASNSAAVMDQAKIAGTAAQAAEEYAKEADEKAQSAYEAYVEAQEAYEEAVKVAEDANKAADEAIANALDDAEEAVKYAKLAEKRAEELKAVMEGKLEAAKGTQEYYEKGIEKAEARISELEKALPALEEEYSDCHDDYDEATQAYRDMMDALRTAQDAYNKAPSESEIGQLSYKVLQLENAKKQAERALEALKVRMNNDEKAYEAAKELYDAAKESYDSIMESYNAAVKDKEAAEAEVTSIQGSISELKSQYGDNIISEQDALRNAETSETKDAAAGALIKTVAVANNTEFTSTTTVTKLNIEATTDLPNGVFMAQDGENVKFFTYAIVDGVVKVVDCEKVLLETIQKAVDPTVQTELSQADFDEIVAGLADGTYFYSSETIVTPETYTVKYTENTYRGVDNRYDRVGKKGTIVIDGNTYDVEYDYADYSWDTYWWIHTNRGWQVLPYYYYPNIIVASSEKTVNNVSSSELDSYKSKTGYSATSNNDGSSVTKYSLTSGLTSQTGLSAEELEEAKKDGKYYSYVANTSKEVTFEDEEYVKEVIVVYNNSTNHFYNGVQNAPELENGEIKYLCEFTIGGITYSTSDGTLRWYNNSWQIKYVNNRGVQDTEFSNITSKFTGNNLSSHMVKEYKNVQTMSVEDANKVKSNNVKSKTEVTGTRQVKVEKEVTTYTVYYKSTTSEDVYGYNSLETSTEFSNISKTLKDAQDAANAINPQKILDDNKRAIQDYNKKKAAYEEAEKKYGGAKLDYQDALKAYNDANYDQKIADAKDNLQKAQNERNTAKENLDTAKKNMAAADKAAAEATRKLNAITDKINANKGETKEQKRIVSELGKKVEEAKKAVAYWQEKVTMATTLEADAEAARIKAEEARDAIKALKASNVGAEALAAAEAEFEAAEAAYKAAREAADQAAKDAEEAAEEFQRLIDRAIELAEEEARTSGGEEGGEDETPAPTVITPAAPALTAAPAVRAARANAVAAAPAAAVEETTTIEEPETALAASVDDEATGDELTNIEDQETALAASVVDEEHVAWWWLIVIAVLGGTGYAIYNKSQKKKEEKAKND